MLPLIVGSSKLDLLKKLLAYIRLRKENKIYY
jgi:hypothetical protein